MKNLLKKTLAAALAAMIVLGIAPLAGLAGISLPSFDIFASAAEEEPVWTVATDDMLKIEGNTITGYTDKLEGNIELPTKTANGTAITKIESQAFEGCSALTAVKIGEKIASIGNYAFQKCDNLEKVYFNSDSCKMTYVSGLETDAAPFAYNAKLTEFIFGENVSSVSDCVCMDATSLQKVVFNGKVVSVGNNAFRNCSSLEFVDLSNVKTIGSAAFANCVSVNEFKFSEKLESIGPEAFYGCLIKEITIPVSVTSIGNYAFQKCDNLEKVYFNSDFCKMTYVSGLKTDAAPFAYNAKLTEFVFGENVSSVSDCVCMDATSLEKVVFNGKVVSVGNNAFRNCSSLEFVDLSNVKTIGSAAFANCVSVNEFKFSEKLESIGPEAFYGCLIKEITIPVSVTSIGNYAFQKCDNLEKVYFNSDFCKMTYVSGLKTDAAPFAYNAKLTEFVFGENVSSVSDCVCMDATSLEKVVFNGIITNISNYAFGNCKFLEEIHLAAYSKETFDFDKLTIGSNNDVVTEDIFTFGIETKTETNEEYGVTVSYISTTFDTEVKLSITDPEGEGERENGTINISDREYYEQISCFNIKMILADDSSTETIQPNGKVKIKMAIPEKYIGRTNFKIVHRFSTEGRETFSTTPTGDDKKLYISSDGKYCIFEVESFSKFEFLASAPTVSIKNKNSKNTINYGETLELTANVTDMPADAKIFWHVDGVKKAEGTTFKVSPESGSVEVTVKVVSADGNDYYGDIEISDSQTVTVKAGFFQKLISFFKNLFGLNRVVTQTFGFYY